MLAAGCKVTEEAASYSMGNVSQGNFVLNPLTANYFGNRKRSYTDTANFTLRCGVCQIGVIGEKEAVEHAQATGHVNFQEYK
ncbi:hypothetical protein Taro_029579 [Colocasia esculenta]|uniref:OTU1-like C-terminal C2H2-type zinc finger domain-containing protein n=1 Tax=Colocasia esculenta TaxID=4460 RepID=A0A843W0P3_COLES|nr:hypothetical protein [Colocasia esculenta]